MPVEAHITFGNCIAVAGLSAFYPGGEDKRTRALAGVGLLPGGGALFVSGMYLLSLPVALLIVILPVVLAIARLHEAFA